MSGKLTMLGHGRIYQDPRTGELIVDTDSVRRNRISGDEDFGADDDDIGDDDDDFGDDDDDFGDEDDDIGDEDEDSGEAASLGDEIGANKKKRRRKLFSRLGKKKKSQRPQRKKGHPMKVKSTQKWAATILSGSTSLTAAGTWSIQIRPQHTFRAKDLTFDGSSNGARVSAIFFGDVPVWSASGTGVPASVFGTSSTIRNLLSGQKLQAGLDITISGSLAGAGEVTATLTGTKPIISAC